MFIGLLVGAPGVWQCSRKRQGESGAPSQGCHFSFRFHPGFWLAKGQFMSTELNPSAILQTAFGFWNSKVLLTAVEFGLFSKLGQRRLTGQQLGAELELHPRAISDFLDSLVAMRFLEREGDGPQASYFNTPEGLLYLDESSPRYI